jgi:hypothetical protein
MPDNLDVKLGDAQSVSEVMLGLVQRPGDCLWRRWNWKAAVLSSVLRGSIFFSVNLFASLGAAVSALATELIFRPFVAGYYGAVTESFRSAVPAWAATAVIVVLIPAVNHVLELSIHWARGTRRLGASILVSVGFSILSGLFNMFAMRRGVLIVGEGRRSFADDLKRIPGVVVKFLAAPAAWVLQYARARKAARTVPRA